MVKMGFCHESVRKQQVWLLRNRGSCGRDAGSDTDSNRDSDFCELREDRGLFEVRCHKTKLLTRQCRFRNKLLAHCMLCLSVKSQCRRRAEPAMNYRSPWGAAAAQVKEKVFFFFFFLI